MILALKYTVRILSEWHTSDCFSSRLVILFGGVWLIMINLICVWKRKLENRKNVNGNWLITNLEFLWICVRMIGSVFVTCVSFSDGTIIADIYCHYIDRVNKASFLVNKIVVILQRDITKPHSAKLTLEKKIFRRVDSSSNIHMFVVVITNLRPLYASGFSE